MLIFRAWATCGIMLLITTPKIVFVGGYEYSREACFGKTRPYLLGKSLTWFSDLRPVFTSKKKMPMRSKLQRLNHLWSISNVLCINTNVSKRQMEGKLGLVVQIHFCHLSQK